MLDHVKTVSDSIQIATGILSTMSVNQQKMLASLDPFMLVRNLSYTHICNILTGQQATDLADYCKY